jgi:uncharacterized paraquat-inducible protein A
MGNLAAGDHQFAVGNSVMPTSLLILVYVIVLLGALAGIAIYTEFRQRRFKPSASEDKIFRCQKCGYVYTDDPDVDRSRCAQCGKMNEAIEF